MRDIGTLGGLSSGASGNNNLDQVVGGATVPNGEYHAYLWTSVTGMQDLNTLIPANSGWLLTGASDINDAGQIVGSGQYQGQQRAFLLTPVASSGPDEDLNPSGWYHLAAAHSGKCLDVSGGSTGEFVPLVQWPCHSGWNQQWQFTAVESGVYQITVRHSGLSLGVSNGSTDAGAQLAQQTWTGQPWQQWRVARQADGTWKIIAKHSGQAVDVCGASMADGSCIIQWPDWGGVNQRWRMIPK